MEQEINTVRLYQTYNTAAFVVIRIQGHLSDISQVKLGTKSTSQCLTAGSIKRISLVRNVKTLMLIKHLIS